MRIVSLIEEHGFGDVKVATVTKTIRFPSVLDYVRSQLVATPMASLLANTDPNERKAAIVKVAAQTVLSWNRRSRWMDGCLSRKRLMSRSVEGLSQG